MHLKCSKREVLYFTTWFFYFFSYTICVASECSFLYNMEKIHSIIRYSCLFLLMLIILNSRFRLKKLPTAIFVVGSVFISVISAHSVSFLFTIMFALALGDIKFDRFVRFDLCVRFFSFFIVLLMCVMGIVDNYSLYINGTYKQAFGFVHPNTLGLYIATILVEYVYIRFDKLKLRDYIMVLLCLAVLYKIGNSRTAQLLISVLLISTILVKKYKIQKLINKKIIRNLVSYAPAIIIAFCFITSYFYDNTSRMWKAFDKLLTTRLQWANYYLKNFGLSLFGQKLELISARSAKKLGLYASNSFDMAHVRIGVQYGIVVLGIVIVGMILMHKYIVTNNDWKLLVCSLFFLLLGIVENAMFSVSMNIFLILLFRPILGGSYQESLLKSRNHEVS